MLPSLLPLILIILSLPCLCLTSSFARVGPKKVRIEELDDPDVVELDKSKNETKPLRLILDTVGFPAKVTRSESDAIIERWRSHMASKAQASFFRSLALQDDQELVSLQIPASSRFLGPRAELYTLNLQTNDSPTPGPTLEKYVYAMEVALRFADPLLDLILLEVVSREIEQAVLGSGAKLIRIERGRSLVAHLECADGAEQLPKFLRLLSEGLEDLATDFEPEDEEVVALQERILKGAGDLSMEGMAGRLRDVFAKASIHPHHTAIELAESAEGNIRVEDPLVLWEFARVLLSGARQSISQIIIQEHQPADPAFSREVLRIMGDLICRQPLNLPDLIAEARPIAWPADEEPMTLHLAGSYSSQTRSAVVVGRQLYDPLILGVKFQSCQNRFALDYLVYTANQILDQLREVKHEDADLQAEWSASGISHASFMIQSDDYNLLAMAHLSSTAVSARALLAFTIKLYDQVLRKTIAALNTDSLDDAALQKAVLVHGATLNPPGLNVYKHLVNRILDRRYNFQVPLSCLKELEQVRVADVKTFLERLRDKPNGRLNIASDNIKGPSEVQEGAEWVAATSEGMEAFVTERDMLPSMRYYATRLFWHYNQIKVDTS